MYLFVDHSNKDVGAHLNNGDLHLNSRCSKLVANNNLDVARSLSL